MGKGEEINTVGYFFFLGSNTISVFRGKILIILFYLYLYSSYIYIYSTYIYYISIKYMYISLFNSIYICIYLYLIYLYL